MEEAFEFGVESPAGDVEPYGSMSEAPVSGVFAGAEPLEMPREADFSSVAGDLASAPEEKPVPAAAAFAAVPAAVEPGGTITLTEEQLAAAISRISREVIERIAWEVVPDLAETLIKEEIRRIKGGS